MSTVSRSSGARSAPTPTGGTNARSVERRRARARLNAFSDLAMRGPPDRAGLDGGKRMTLEEVGKKFGVTRERMRQLQNSALDKLRRALSKKEKPIGIPQEVLS